jgi:peptidyl-prolyl cis-trans isomerase C
MTYRCWVGAVPGTNIFDGTHHCATRKTMKTIAAFCIYALIGVGCSGGSGDTSPPMAKVGDVMLTERDLGIMLRRQPGESASPEERWAAAERWVNRELLFAEALRRGIHLQPDVQLQVKTATRELVINSLLEQFYDQELSVTDAEVQQYYDEHRTLFRRPELTIRVRQIVLDNSREARAVYRQLRSAPANFEEVARSQSTDPSAADGGDLGYVSTSTAYNNEIWQAAQKLSEGEIGKAVSTDAGWHVLYVTDKRPQGSMKTLEEVKLEIVNRIRATRRWTLITEQVERLKLQEPYAFYANRLGPRELPLSVEIDTLSVLEDINAHE